MERTDVTLVLPCEPEPKGWRGRRNGTEVIQASWTGAGKPRETRKRFDSGDDARDALEKAMLEKMARGFVLLRDPAEAAPGEVVFDGRAPRGSFSGTFDLHPDGRTVALATTDRKAFSAEIHLLDLRTGALRTVLSTPGDGRRQQAVVHAVVFDPSGESLVYGLSEETRRLDLRTGATARLAGYREHVDARFNPFRLAPARDAARRHLVLFDAGDRVRVLGPDDRPVLEIAAASPATDVWRVALSPSGRLLALCRRARGGGGGASEVEVWDVGAGALLGRVTIAQPLDRVGFDPTERLLLASRDLADGPGAFSLETGEEAWHLPDSFRTDRWRTCFSWAFSPDGKRLAVGGNLPALLDAATREPVEIERNERQRTYGIAFSRDGALLVAGGDQGRLVARRM